VHTARVDHLRRRDGSLIASAAVAGVLTYRDSQVVHWKEYFDPTTFTGRVAVNALRHAVRR
jgi:limonene-1,2-epoxide hydrolase